MPRGNPGRPKRYTVWNKGTARIIDRDTLALLYYDKKLSLHEIAEHLEETSWVVENSFKHHELRLRDRRENAYLSNSKNTALRLANARRGRSHHWWRGGRYKTQGGYIAIYAPGHHKHPNAIHAFEHVVVWEQTHGRRVPDGFDIHHINGVRDDNRPENLEAVPHRCHEKHTLLKVAQRRIRELEEELRSLRNGNAEEV